MNKRVHQPEIAVWLMTEAVRCINNYNLEYTWINNKSQDQMELQIQSNLTDFQKQNKK